MKQGSRRAEILGGMVDFKIAIWCTFVKEHHSIKQYIGLKSHLKIFHSSRLRSFHSCLASWKDSLYRILAPQDASNPPYGLWITFTVCLSSNSNSEIIQGCKIEFATSENGPAALSHSNTFKQYRFWPNRAMGVLRSNLSLKLVSERLWSELINFERDLQPMQK